MQEQIKNLENQVSVKEQIKNELSKKLEEARLQHEKAGIDTFFLLQHDMTQDNQALQKEKPGLIQMLKGQLDSISAEYQAHKELHRVKEENEKLRTKLQQQEFFRHEPPVAN